MNCATQKRDRWKIQRQSSPFNRHVSKPFAICTTAIITQPSKPPNQLEKTAIFQNEKKIQRKAPKRAARNENSKNGSGFPEAAATSDYRLMIRRSISVHVFKYTYINLCMCVCVRRYNNDNGELPRTGTTRNVIRATAANLLMIAYFQIRSWNTCTMLKWTLINFLVFKIV